MNKTTIPAPFETPAPTPGCPYECLRLGLGLRTRDAVRLTFLVVATALFAVACGGIAEESTDAGAAAVEAYLYASALRMVASYRTGG